MLKTIGIQMNIITIINVNDNITIDINKTLYLTVNMY